MGLTLLQKLPTYNQSLVSVDMKALPDDFMFEVGTEPLLDESGLALVWKLLPR